MKKSPASAGLFVGGQPRSNMAIAKFPASIIIIAQVGETGTMRRLTALPLILAVMASLFPSVSEARTADQPLEASSKWVVNYDGDRCVLSRQFGPETDRAFVQFIRYAPANGFALNLIGERFAAYDNTIKVGIRFGESGPLVPTDALSGAVNRLPLIMAHARLDNAAPDPAITETKIPVATEAAVTTLHTVVEGRHSTLALGPMDKPMAALRTCEDALVRQWGLDPVQQAALNSHPRPLTPPQKRLQPSDYPRDSIAVNEQASVAFRLMIGADGTPTDCAVQSNIADNKRFAAITCSTLMRRARFEPARSATGSAVASYFVSQVNWIIR